MYWPFVVYAALVVLATAGLLGGSYLIGERRRGTITAEPYETGIRPTGSAERPVSIKFYEVALFFVVFDVESVFIFAWAIRVRELGWFGYVAVLVFVTILLLMLAYLVKEGALGWGGTFDRLAKRGPKEGKP
jgi:NADH-quinone oxidoreductase subunit A